MKREFRIAFEEFFTSPTKQRSQEIVQSSMGEFDYLDYKKELASRPGGLRKANGHGVRP